jgi:hypothetical protein
MAWRRKRKMGKTVKWKMERSTDPPLWWWQSELFAAVQKLVGKGHGRLVPVAPLLVQWLFPWLLPFFV